MPNHHFGRVPLVMKFGDLLQLTPTANLGLIQDVNENDEDGPYKYPETPSLEVQHAQKVCKHFLTCLSCAGRNGLSLAIC